MRSQKPEARCQNNRHRIQVVFVGVLFFVFCSLAAFGSEKWSGVDESVIGKIAKEHGRETREPMINTDKGDLLLFVFLLAGAIGGFAAGYYWRMLSEHKRQNTERRLHKKEHNVTE